MDSNRKKSPFLEKIRHLMRVQHYAIRTEQAYVDWIRRFILYHGKPHPDEMGEQEVSQFLTHLVVNRNVAPATRGQALNALVFLYRKNSIGHWIRLKALFVLKRKQKCR